MTEFTRLTVVGTTHKAELVVPDDESLGGLIPRLMDLLQEPTGTVARPLTLVRATGEQLDAALSAAQQQLADGEQLRLVRADDAPPPPEVADVTDVVGDTFAQRSGRWSDRSRSALGAVTIGAAALLATLAADLTVGTGVLVLVVLSAGALLLGRGARSAGPWPTLALTAAAAGAAVPIGQDWAAAWSAGTPGLPSYAWVALSAAAVWVVLGLGVGVGLGHRPAVLGATAGAALSVAPFVLVELGVAALPSAGVGVVAGTVVCGLLPWYALSSSGLTGLDDQVLAGRPSRREHVLRTVDDAYRGLSWAAFGVAVPITVAAAVLVTGGDRWTLALGVDAIALLALRTRAFPLVVQQLPLALGAVTATAVALLVRLGASGQTTTVVLVALAVLVAVAVGVRPADHQRARLRRGGNLLEAVGVIALLPLLLGVFGVYADLIGAFR